jgi:hypothetical protein
LTASATQVMTSNGLMILAPFFMARREPGLRAGELGRAHHQPDFPGNDADEGKDGEGAQIGGEVQKLRVRRRLEQAVAGERDKGEHEEGAGAGAENAIVKTYQRHDDQPEQEWPTAGGRGRCRPCSA